MLARLGAAAFRAAYAPYNSADDLELHLGNHYTTQAISAEMDAGKIYSLARVGRQPVGLCKYHIASSPAAMGTGRSLQIEQLYVSPDVQRGGVGRKLVAHCLGVARAQGLDALWLSVWEKANWAIDFYLACEFEQFGEQEFFLGESRQNDLLMGLACRPGEDP